MKTPNLHIIVGEPRRCLCGLYQRGEEGYQYTVSCCAVLAALKRISNSAHPLNCPPDKEDVDIIQDVLSPMVQDCS